MLMIGGHNFRTQWFGGCYGLVGIVVIDHYFLVVGCAVAVVAAAWLLI